MVVSRSGAVGDEQDPEPVVAEVAEAVGDAAGLLDQSVDGFGAALETPSVVKNVPPGVHGRSGLVAGGRRRVM